jgi:hypothetical protein
MRVTTNEQLLKRRAKIVRWTSLIGLVVLGGGLVASFKDEYIVFAMPALVLGFVLANISAYNANRYVKEPRSDQALEKALRGFDNTHHLFNFTAPVPHVLLTPSKIYALTVKAQDGQIWKEGERWRRNFNLRRILLFFNDESLGNPTREAHGNANQLNKDLAEVINEGLPPAMPIIVFTNPDVQLEGTESSLSGDGEDVPVVRGKELKKYLRSQPRGTPLDKEMRKGLVEFLQGQAR